MARNNRRSLKKIDNKTYDFLFKNRSANQSTIYADPYLHYPSEDAKKSFSYREHYWKTGDRFYKLSQKYYGTLNDWWIIARFNGKPTEANVELGERLLIPLPLSAAKSYMGYYNGQT